MLSFPSSNFLTKFKESQRFYSQNETEIIEETASISEIEGSEHFTVHFSVSPKEVVEASNRSTRGSCFALLRRLVKGLHSAMPLTKETLVNILSRNNQLLDELKQSKQSLENNEHFINGKKDLIISVEGEDLTLRIPTHDFAVVRLNDSLFICTTLEDEPERVFLKVSQFSENLEALLRSFMAPPEATNLNSFSLPILPSIDTNSLVIRPSNHFENFIDDTQDYDETQSSYSHTQPQVETSKSQHKASNHSPSRPPKRSDSAVKSANTGNRQCLNCFCTSTPMWRRGPDGTASLCNACGVKFKSGKLQMDPETVESNLKRIRLNQQLQQQQQAPMEQSNTVEQVAQNEETQLESPHIEAALLPLQEEEIVLHQY